MGKLVEAIKETIIYWKKVFSEAFKSIGGEVRGIALTVVSIFIVACVSTIGYFYDFATKEWTDQAWWQVFLGLASACVSVSILFTIFFFVLAYLPSKIHKKQVARLEEIDPDLSKIILTGVSIGDMGGIFRKGVGINIKNLTSEDFECILELIDVKLYMVDRYCEEHESDFPIDISNNRFPVTKINGNDHAVVSFAELVNTLGEEKGEGLILLTEKKNTSICLLDMLFVVPEYQEELDYAKMYIGIEFEVIGKLGKNEIREKFSTLITLRVSVLSRTDTPNKGMGLGTRVFDSYLDIGEIMHEYKGKIQA